MIEMVTEYFIPGILTTKGISKVTQYDFDMPYMKVTPRRVKVPSQEDDLGGISGLDSI